MLSVFLGVVELGFSTDIVIEIFRTGRYGVFFCVRSLIVYLFGRLGFVVVRAGCRRSLEGVDSEGFRFYFSLVRILGKWFLIYIFYVIYILVC